MGGVIFYSFLCLCGVLFLVFLIYVDDFTPPRFSLSLSPKPSKLSIKISFEGEEGEKNAFKRDIHALAHKLKIPVIEKEDDLVFLGIEYKFLDQLIEIKIPPEVKVSTVILTDESEYAI